MNALRTLSITEAVTETGIPRATLYRLVESGQVKGNRASSRGRWRVQMASLVEWIQNAPKDEQPVEEQPSQRSRDQKLREDFGITERLLG